MSLSINVGVLADLQENDPEGAEWLREDLDHLNELLVENGLPVHREPEHLPALVSRCSLASYPCSFLHQLRRVYAHLVADPKWTVTPGDDNAAHDPVIQKLAAQTGSHLLYHSDAEGFYIPVDFRDVLVDETGQLPGEAAGSSYRLREELIAIAPALGINLQSGTLPDAEAGKINAEADAEAPLWIEKTVWLSLFEAARLSIEHKTAVCFG